MEFVGNVKLQFKVNGESTDMEAEGVIYAAIYLLSVSKIDQMDLE